MTNSEFRTDWTSHFALLRSHFPSAIAVMLEKHGFACEMMSPMEWKKWTTGKPAERLALIPAGQVPILEQDDGKKRWRQVVIELSRAFALCAAGDLSLTVALTLLKPRQPTPTPVPADSAD